MGAGKGTEVFQNQQPTELTCEGGRNPKALSLLSELTFHKPYGAGKFPKGWRRASRVPKMRKEKRDGPSIREGAGSAEAASGSGGRGRAAWRELRGEGLVSILRSWARPWAGGDAGAGGPCPVPGGHPQGTPGLRCWAWTPVLIR